jgi:hypothetical protein
MVLSLGSSEVTASTSATVAGTRARKPGRRAT